MDATTVRCALQAGNKRQESQQTQGEQRSTHPRRATPPEGQTSTSERPTLAPAWHDRTVSARRSHVSPTL